MRTKIYSLRDENHIVKYIGMRVSHRSLEGRLEQHIQEALNSGHTQCKKCNGIRAMLRRCNQFPTIEEETEVEGNGGKVEQAYIRWYRKQGIDLWNMTDGGDGLINPTKEVIERIRKSQRLRYQNATPEELEKWLYHLRHPSDKVRKKLSLARKGKPTWNKGKTGIYTEKVRDKMGASRRGYKYSKEEKEHRKELRKGKPGPNKNRQFPPEWRKHLSDHSAWKGKPAWNRNKSPSPQTLVKQSAAHKGIPWSPARWAAQALRKKGNSNYEKQ